MQVLFLSYPTQHVLTPAFLAEHYNVFGPCILWMERERSQAYHLPLQGKTVLTLSSQLISSALC